MQSNEIETLNPFTHEKYIGTLVSKKSVLQDKEEVLQTGMYQREQGAGRLGYLSEKGNYAHGHKTQKLAPFNIDKHGNVKMKFANMNTVSFQNTSPAIVEDGVLWSDNSIEKKKNLLTYLGGDLDNYQGVSTSGMVANIDITGSGTFKIENLWWIPKKITAVGSLSNSTNRDNATSNGIAVRKIDGSIYQKSSYLRVRKYEEEQYHDHNVTVHHCSDAGGSETVNSENVPLTRDFLKYGYNGTNNNLINFGDGTTINISDITIKYMKDGLPLNTTGNSITFTSSVAGGSSMSVGIIVEG